MKGIYGTLVFVSNCYNIQLPLSSMHVLQRNIMTFAAFLLLGGTANGPGTTCVPRFCFPMASLKVFTALNCDLWFLVPALFSFSAPLSLTHSLSLSAQLTKYKRCTSIRQKSKSCARTKKKSKNQNDKAYGLKALDGEEKKKDLLLQVSDIWSH